jgi:hypothetical protein
MKWELRRKRGPYDARDHHHPSTHGVVDHERIEWFTVYTYDGLRACVRACSSSKRVMSGNKRKKERKLARMNLEKETKGTNSEVLLNELVWSQRRLQQQGGCSGRYDSINARKDRGYSSWLTTSCSASN